MGPTDPPADDLPDSSEADPAPPVPPAGTRPAPLRADQPTIETPAAEGEAPGSGGAEPTDASAVPTTEWSPGAADEAPTTEWTPGQSSDAPTAPVAAVGSGPAAWSADDSGSPSAMPAPKGQTVTRRAAVVGALAGAVVAAVVAAGVAVGLDDDDPATVRSGPVATPVTTDAGSLDIQAILAKVNPSVVTIETGSASSGGVFRGAGSGIVLSEDGLVLTNAHVIAGSRGDITVVLPDGSEEQAVLVGSSPQDDIAVIQVEGVDDLVPAELGSSEELRVGEEVIAIGNALNLGSDPTVTRGIVSAIDRDLAAEGVRLEGLIQTDAAINPGNSGGPLVNGAGQVVGMNTAIVADAQNLGFSIAIDEARPIIEQIRAGEAAIDPDQAFLGVSSTDVDDLTEVVRSRFDIEVDEGAFITEVVPDSAAEEAGLEVGDVIVEIDGTAVDEASDVRDAILDHEPGDSAELRIVRGGEEETVDVELGRRGDGI